MTTHANTKPLKTPSQDAQGRWFELLSPAQVLTGQEQASTAMATNKIVTTTTSKIKKKRPRNRKFQRYWRKLRKQGLDEATIQMYKRANQLEEQNQLQDIEMEEIIPLNDTAIETTNQSIQRQVYPFL